MTISKEVAELAAKAREGKLQPHEFQVNIVLVIKWNRIFFGKVEILFLLLFSYKVYNSRNILLIYALR